MTKPEANPVAAVTLPEVPNVKHLWQRATLLWNGMFKFILNLVGALAFVLFAMLLYQIATERSIVIEPISVPQSLAANGYTPEVAARRLRDALTKYHEQSQTTMRGSGLTLHSERPNFVVPTVGLSSEAIATFIRDFFGHPRQQQISGEFTIAENQLWLRLRSNGVELYTSTDGASPSNPDALFALAAPKIFEVSEPYIVAATLYSVDRAKSIQRAEEIIAAGPESDQNRFHHRKCQL